MTNEEFQALILKQLQTLHEGQQLIRQELKQDINKLEVRIENEVIDKIRGLNDAREVISDNLTKVNSTLENLAVRIGDLKGEVLLNRRETTDKIRALSDGFYLRGDQIENLKKHIDERLDSIEIDTGYLVSRVARLEKMAK